MVFSWNFMQQIYPNKKYVRMYAILFMFKVSIYSQIATIIHIFIHIKILSAHNVF